MHREKLKRNLIELLPLTLLIFPFPTEWTHRKQLIYFSLAQRDRESTSLGLAKGNKSTYQHLWTSLITNMPMFACAHVGAHLFVSHLQPISSEQVSGRLVVQCQLAGAVAWHADPHQAHQDGHTRHCGSHPVLQHGLGCLSLKERARVTAREAAIISTRHDHHQWGWWPRQRVNRVPLGSGSSTVLKKVTLVSCPSHPSDGLSIREEPHQKFHFLLGFSTYCRCRLQVWRPLKILSQSKTCPKVKYKFCYFLSSSFFVQTKSWVYNFVSFLPQITTPLILRIKEPFKTSIRWSERNSLSRSCKQNCFSSLIKIDIVEMTEPHKRDRANATSRSWSS